MQIVWALASLWVGLALIATLLAIWCKMSTALSEIVVGTVTQLIIGAIVGPNGLAAKSEWITFLAGTGAIVLTFLAGAEPDPIIFRTKWKEATAVGLVGFFGPCSKVPKNSAVKRLRRFGFTGLTDAINFFLYRKLVEAGEWKAQCAVMGWPGQRGQVSLAALSHTVNFLLEVNGDGPWFGSRLDLRTPQKAI